MKCFYLLGCDILIPLNLNNKDIFLPFSQVCSFLPNLESNYYIFEKLLMIFIFYYFFFRQISAAMIIDS